MGWVDRLEGKTLAVDTAPLIYYIEEHPKYARDLQELFEAVDSGKIRIVTSMISLLEVLVHPIKQGNEDLAHQYYDLLMTAEHVSTVAVGANVARLAAELRSTKNLKTPDAIQLATAIEAGAESFLTNDRDLGEHQSIVVLQLDQLIS